MSDRAPTDVPAPDAIVRRTTAPALAGFYRSTVGKKFLVAVSGVVLFGYVVVHMLGNLQVYLGAAQINRYGELLHAQPALLWGARVALLAAVVVHIVASLQLAAANTGARPRYRRQRYRDADWASRTMILSGPVIAGFVIYHVLHFTTGSVHPSFVEGDVFHNVTAGFRVAPVAIFYVVANLLLGLHLYHGVWSLFQTLGISHPAWDPWRRVFAVAFAVLVTAGMVSIPLAVLAGLVG